MKLHLLPVVDGTQEELHIKLVHLYSDLQTLLPILNFSPPEV